MGYRITIGELVPADSSDEASRPDAQSVTLDEAPAFGEPTDYTNERWPSYTGWNDFLSATGLGFLSPCTCREFARNAECPPLMDEHPGVMPVLPVHLAKVEEALARYRARIGADKKPGWGSTEVFDQKSGTHIEVQEADHELYDGNLARLTWLRFWLKWALENCKNPVCANS